MKKEEEKEEKKIKVLKVSSSSLKILVCYRCLKLYIPLKSNNNKKEKVFTEKSSMPNVLFSFFSFSIFFFFSCSLNFSLFLPLLHFQWCLSTCRNRGRIINKPKFDWSFFTNAFYFNFAFFPLNFQTNFSNTAKKTHFKVKHLNILFFSPCAGT